MKKIAELYKVTINDLISNDIEVNEKITTNIHIPIELVVFESALKKMPQEEIDRMMLILKLTFKEYFEEDK